MLHQVNLFSPYDNEISIFSYFKQMWVNFVWSDWYKVTPFSGMEWGQIMNQ